MSQLLPTLFIGTKGGRVITMSTTQKQENTSNNKPFQRTVALDFDGVMNTYNGWKGADELFEPRPGLENFLKTLQRDGFRMVIYSTRAIEKIQEWLTKYKVDQYIAFVSNEKPLAHCYVDDRAIQFQGSFYDAYMQIGTFRTFWEAENDRLKLEPDKPLHDDDVFFKQLQERAMAELANAVPNTDDWSPSCTNGQ